MIKLCHIRGQLSHINNVGMNSEKTHDLDQDGIDRLSEKIPAAPLHALPTDFVRHINELARRYVEIVKGCDNAGISRVDCSSDLVVRGSILNLDLFKMSESIIILAQANLCLQDSNNAIVKRLQFLESRVDEIYYAPQMPGYNKAQRDWNERVTREKRS